MPIEHQITASRDLKKEMERIGAFSKQKQGKKSHCPAQQAKLMFDQTINIYRN